MPLNEDPPKRAESPQRNGRIAVGLVVLAMLMGYSGFLLTHNVAPAFIVGILAAVCALAIQTTGRLFLRSNDASERTAPNDVES
jgi:hypothetical protein